MFKTGRQAGILSMSAQNDNVLIAQSRNVLLTGSGWRGGIRNISHDPTGPRPADRSEESQEGADHPASSCRRDRANRTTYPPIAGKAEKGGRPGGGPRAAGKTIQPQAGGEEPGPGDGDPGAGKVSRVRSHAGQRVSEQASPDHGQPRNGKGVDDRSAAVAASETESDEDPPVAPEAVAMRRTGAMGHQRAPVAGRARTEAVSDQHDRRRHQPATCALCAARLDRGKYASAVELFGAAWTSPQLLHRQGEPVSNRSEDCARCQRTAARRTGTAAAHADWTGAVGDGNRLDRSAFAAGQGTSGTKFSDGAGPSGERPAGGRSKDFGGSECLSGNGVHPLVEPDSGCRGRHRCGCTSSACQEPFAAGLVELCGKQRSGHWLYHPVRQPDLPHCPRRYSCRSARCTGADRGAVGWVHGRAFPRSLRASEPMFSAPQSSGASQEAQKARPRPATEESVDEELSLHPSRQSCSFRCSGETDWVGRAEAARRSSRFLYSKPPLQSFTKVICARKAKPSEGTPQGPVDRGLAAVYFGANSVASALNLPQERGLPKNHPHFKPYLSILHSKQDISTLRTIGHFYFALTAEGWGLGARGWCNGRVKVILFGASGMVGQGALRECLIDPEVQAVLSIGRSAIGRQHPKLQQLLHQNFLDYSDVEDRLAGFDACFFCLGVSSAGMSEERYSHVTYDIALAAGRTLARLNPSMTFIYVSGM